MNTRCKVLVGSVTINMALAVLCGLVSRDLVAFTVIGFLLASIGISELEDELQQEDKK